MVFSMTSLLNKPQVNVSPSRARCRPRGAIAATGRGDIHSLEAYFAVTSSKKHGSWFKVNHMVRVNVKGQVSKVNGQRSSLRALTILDHSRVILLPSMSHSWYIVSGFSTKPINIFIYFSCMLCVPMYTGQ